MGLRKSRRPQFESLELKMVMSAGVSTALVGDAMAIHAREEVRPRGVVEITLKRSLQASLSHTRRAQDHSGLTASSVLKKTHEGSNPSHTIALIGQADGYYLSTEGNPDSGTVYTLTAAGKITPVGQEVVSGSFQTPGFIRGGQASGSLTIVGTHGTLTLKLSAPGPILAGASNNGEKAINPGGPMKGGSPAVSEGPAILVNFLRYTIIAGTRKYAHAHGSGTLNITTTPGITSPTAPGIYFGPATLETGFGRTTLTFGNGVLPLV